MAPSQIWIIFPPRIRGETYKQIFDFPPAIFNGSFFLKATSMGLFFFWGGAELGLDGFPKSVANSSGSFMCSSLQKNDFDFVTVEWLEKVWSKNIIATNCVNFSWWLKHNGKNIKIHIHKPKKQQISNLHVYVRLFHKFAKFPPTNMQKRKTWKPGIGVLWFGPWQLGST